MTQDIEPLTYQHRTNIDEHRQFFAKINEIIANLAPTVAEAEEAIAQANAAIAEANESLAAVQTSASAADEAAANAALSAGSASEAAANAASSAAAAQLIADSKQPVKTPIAAQITQNGIYVPAHANNDLIAGYVKFYDNGEGMDVIMFVTFIVEQTTVSRTNIVGWIPAYPDNTAVYCYMAEFNAVNRLLTIRATGESSMAGITVNEVSLFNYH